MKVTAEHYNQNCLQHYANTDCRQTLGCTHLCHNISRLPHNKREKLNKGLKLKLFQR
ncbi:hypothetical protein M514_21352 [Trichuris suis]|uniref:Uncharacterized protein n=1 Tax=Trichuris suis TaxID=68888 RepID=A0A085NAL2_9BILA|nr:hypothetical protein M514_21352 [Trichuris suis]